MRAFTSSKRTWRISLAAACFAVFCMTAGVANAKKKRHHRKGAAAAAAPVNDEALGKLMGPFSFGMNKENILKVLSKQLTKSYAEKIRSTSDVYEQDKLRREKGATIKKIRNSFTEFKGTKTGWDVSIIDDQFAHKTKESMLVYWEHNADGPDQRRFFFFHDGDLYKMLIILDSALLPADQRSFDSFRALMAQRYGAGTLVTATKRSGEVYPVLVDWKSSKFHVQALDKLSFYRSFCLTIANPSVEADVISARDANKTAKKSNTLINSMIEDDDAPPPSLDSNTAGIDAILNGSD